MFILDVVPISKNISKETLSYFSAKFVALGAIVSVPVRSKSIAGIVVARHDVASLKADLKNANYKLRNVLSVYKKTLFLPEFIQTCTLLKNFNTTTTGSVIASLVPKLFLDEYLESVPVEVAGSEKPGSELLPEKAILQAPWHERIDFYKTSTRESFATKKSLFIVCPNRTSVERIAQEVEKGIQGRVFAFHGSLTKKQLRTRYEKAVTEHQSIVIIATAGFLFIPRSDLGTLIVEEEGSGHYRQMTRPYLDERDVAFTFAQVKKLRYIVADQFLQVATLWLAKEERYEEIKPLSFHAGKHHLLKIVDMRTVPDETEKKEENKKGENHKRVDFKVFSPEAEEMLKASLEKKEKIICYVTRKGLAPMTACEHCGEILKSPDSGAPLVLLQKKHADGTKKPMYQCPQTNQWYDPVDRCPSCDSWKLKLLGIGIETVEKYLAQQFPNSELFIVDSKHTTTHRAVEKTMRAFQESPSGILIATEKVLPYLETAESIIVVSIDTLFSLSSYRAGEKTMRILLKLMDVAQKNVLVQTRMPDHDVLLEIQKGNIIDFYQKEITQRKSFHYPPFVHLLNISVQTTPAGLTKQKEYLLHLFQGTPLDPHVVIRPGAKRGSVNVNVLVKITPSDWIRRESTKRPGTLFRMLVHRLEELTPQYKIAINPESI